MVREREKEREGERERIQDWSVYFMASTRHLAHTSNFSSAQNSWSLSTQYLRPDLYAKCQSAHVSRWQSKFNSHLQAAKHLYTVVWICTSSRSLYTIKSLTHAVGYNLQFSVLWATLNPVTNTTSGFHVKRNNSTLHFTVNQSLWICGCVKYTTKVAHIHSRILSNCSSKFLPTYRKTLFPPETTFLPLSRRTRSADKPKICVQT